MEAPVVSSVPDAAQTQALQAMGFDELIQNVNPQNNQDITDIMKSKFQIHENRIHIVSENSPTKFQIVDGTIRIRDLDMANDFVNNFCSAVIKLNFEGHTFADVSKSKQTLELINKMCTNLVEVELPSDWSTSLPKPFENVEKAAVMGDCNEKLDLNVLYPKLKELRLYRMTNPSFVIQNIPNLETVVYSFGNLPDPLIEPFMMQNPQIEVFESRVYLSLPFIRKVNMMLPNLKTITLYPYREQFLQNITPIIFKNVENLIIREWYEYKLPNFPFVFNNLKNFTYYQFGSKSPFNSDWLKAVSNAPILEEIAAPESTMTTQNVMELTNRFTNLKAVTFSFMSNSMNDLVQLLFNIKLDRMSITHIPTSVSRDTLTVNLPSKWTYKFVNEMPANGMGTILLNQKTI